MNIERNYLRRSYRIKIPAKVYIEGKEYRVKDWSFLGFRIENADEIIEQGKIYNIEFELPFVNFLMRFKAKAECRWKKNNEAGFQFEELPDETKLLMKEYVEAYIEGRLTEDNGILKLAQGLEIPVSTDVTITPEEEKEFNKKLLKNVFIIFILIIIAGAIGYIIYLSKGTIYSEEAFVSGKTFYIKSPIKGEIEKIYISPLKKINKNDLIVLIKNKELLEQINTYKQNIQKIKQNIQKIKQMIQKEKEVIDKEYQNEIAIKNKKLLNLKSLLKKKEAYLNNLKKIYSTGIIHYDEIQKVKEEIENLKNEISILKSKKIIKNYSALIPLKNFLINQNKILIDYQSKLNLLENKKKFFNLKSPINGKVINIYVKKYANINKNQLIASIEIASKGYVIGRFTFKDVKNINIGDKAEIYIPSNGKIYKGIVSAIGKNALKSNSTFSESAIYSQKDVPVKINILEDNDLNDGIFAEVKIYTK